MKNLEKFQKNLTIHSRFRGVYIRDFEGYTWIKFLSLVSGEKNRCDLFNKVRFWVEIEPEF